jgi:hypothetical protein
MAEQDVVDADGRGKHRVVLHVPADRSQHLVGRLPHRHPHRLCRKDSRHHELQIGDSADAACGLVDEAAQTNTHGQQEEQR